jgi:hypothetical protein
MGTGLVTLSGSGSTGVWFDELGSLTDPWLIGGLVSTPKVPLNLGTNKTDVWPPISVRLLLSTTLASPRKLSLDQWQRS